MSGSASSCPENSAVRGSKGPPRYCALECLPREDPLLQLRKAVQLYVLRLVDYTHPATAEFFDNAKMRYRLANKRIEAGHAQHNLGCASNQVNEP
jgi:hypothetical protein